VIPGEPDTLKGVRPVRRGEVGVLRYPKTWPLTRLETAKDSGMDHYEVRTWTAWYRFITLTMLAQAFLAGSCAQEPVSQETETTAQERRLLPVTRGEVRSLLGYLIWPHPHNVPLLLAWSWWRRCHRSTACYFHTKRRQEKGDPVLVSEDRVLSLPSSL
jgi:hypothetical protein